ncbi:ExbD/TolR family protein [Aureliella helgolandensis]|uniref:Biopolymer transport protein ExbD/TolR n=1 Tax=Aureliella helgolandensis TaxID=2527968 RepID=A0A518GFJ0_9BACT|nr:biopolymer transporter ExbD [Aureliella helgolandensis]QDV27359.1 Biopolymer transport protein ExbD/TolR [Aureliella helgolandensis]
MALRFQCPACKAVKAANPRLLGREIACPACGAPVQLPSQAQIDEEQRERAEHKRQLAALATVMKQTTTASVVEEVESAESIEHRMAAEERALAANSANFVRPKPPAGEDMDMTPMVDVTFLLLIFFMITASFSVQKSIPRPPPRAEDPSTQVTPDPEDQQDLVTVQVDEFNAYNIITPDWDRICGSKQDLIVALNEAHSGGTPGSQPVKLVIQAHEDCIHGAVIAALDAGREAQFANFEVSTVEQFD